MDPKSTDFESYSAGYRQAVCDIIPVPEKPTEKQGNNSGVFLAYLIGLLVGYIVFKFSQE